MHIHTVSVFAALLCGPASAVRPFQYVSERCEEKVGVDIPAKDLPFSRDPPFQQPPCGRQRSLVYVCRGAIMENPNKRAAKKMLYHTLIGIFWASDRTEEEESMLLKTKIVPRGREVEILELEPKSPLGKPLDKDFRGSPPPQLFYEVSSHAPGSPTEILISAESMVPEEKWNDPETKCDFVGSLSGRFVDGEYRVGPAEVVEEAKYVAKRHPTYQPGTSDCQTFTMMLMARLLCLDYIVPSGKNNFMNTGDAIDNIVGLAINNARGRPAVIDALVAARSELYDKFDDWMLLPQHRDTSKWSRQDRERLDEICASDRFAGGQWASNPALEDQWSKEVDYSKERLPDWLFKSGKPGVHVGGAVYRMLQLCRRRQTSGFAAEDLQSEIQEYTYR